MIKKVLLSLFAVLLVFSVCLAPVQAAGMHIAKNVSAASGSVLLTINTGDDSIPVYFYIIAAVVSIIAAIIFSWKNKKR